MIQAEHLGRGGACSGRHQPCSGLFIAEAVIKCLLITNIWSKHPKWWGLCQLWENRLSSSGVKSVGLQLPQNNFLNKLETTRRALDWVNMCLWLCAHLQN